MDPLTLAVRESRVPRLAYESDAIYPAADTLHLVTMRDLLRILRIRWKMILAAAGVAAVAAALTVSMMTPTYMGAALVMVDEQQRHVFSEQADPSVLSNLPTDPSSIESQVQMLQSHALAGQVVDKLKLVDDPEFTGANKTVMDAVMGIGPRLIGMIGSAGVPEPDMAAQRSREGAINKVLSNLNVQAVGLSTIIAVNFRSTSAAKAAHIANVFADTYIANLAAAKSGATEHASKWLADRVSQLGRQAGAADTAVQLYKAENGLIDTSNGTPLTDQQLSSLTTQLIQAQGEQAQAQAKLGRVNQLLKSGRGADITDAVASPLIMQLREQEATLLQQQADLSSRYGPLHPAMQNVNARLGELRKKISEEVGRIVGTAANDAAVAATHVASLKGDMAATTSTTAGLNKARVKLGELVANASSARALYQSYLDRLNQTQQRASFNIPDVHLVSPASAQLSPVSPKKLLIIGGAALAALVLGFLAALVADRMCNGFRSANELEAGLGLSMLAAVPDVKSRKGGLWDIGMEVLKQPLSQFSEAIRGLEIGLSRRVGMDGASGTGKAYLVTSALPADGKTSISVSLARHLAMSGHRVVIIDADHRRPRVAAALGLRNVKFCLDDYLQRRCSLDQALSSDPHSPLVVMAGSGNARELDLAGSPAMASLIARLREIVDFVVIDSPPVLAVHDAKLLAQMTDGTLFVVRWGKTPREAVSAALKLLREFGAKIAGTVLVRTNADQYQYYAYGYAGVPAMSDYFSPERRAG
jgi:succinoglycan biosynthesis transport protein ExoP